MWGEYMWGLGNMILILVLGLLLLAMLIAVIVAIVFAVRSARSRSTASEIPRRADALEILKERYARGEINREEYQNMRRDLDT